MAKKHERKEAEDVEGISSEATAAEDGKEASPDADAQPDGSQERGSLSPEEIEEMKSLLQNAMTAAKELEAEKNKYLRLAAEYDNFRKRSQKEKEQIFSDAKADIALKFLPVHDNLERALKQNTADEAFYKGVEMTMAGLLEVFEALGLKEIPAENEKFDPAFHNAVMHIEDEELGGNTIAEVFQKGFTLGERVIRFAMVKVAN